MENNPSVVGENVMSFVDLLETYSPFLSIFFVDRSIRVIGKRCPFVRLTNHIAVSVIGDVWMLSATFLSMQQHT